eukprot:CAMPEP_0185335114 /NCGR_PEP_ID=MMETSP1363-20130426/86786_1 /TAXON_ID=38817 /ORGANISM="Gephyrocapsa oceanica, Strain RCC1303" /LENGTH=306 /DNA_ID=CAMNT_0027934123 /DNA_START=64 /DNA_END=983 /DNA_ORIENTATION=-
MRRKTGAPPPPPRSQPLHSRTPAPRPPRPAGPAALHVCARARRGLRAAEAARARRVRGEEGGGGGQERGGAWVRGGCGGRGGERGGGADRAEKLKRLRHAARLSRAGRGVRCGAAAAWTALDAGARLAWLGGDADDRLVGAGPPAVERRLRHLAVVACQLVKLAQPLVVPLPTVLAHGISRGIKLAATRIPALEACAGGAATVPQLAPNDARRVRLRACRLPLRRRRAAARHHSLRGRVLLGEAAEHDQRSDRGALVLVVAALDGRALNESTSGGGSLASSAASRASDMPEADDGGCRHDAVERIV